MNCESVSKSLSMFLYGELALDQEQALQDHVDGCEACRKAFETEKLIHAALDERETEAPPALLARCRRDFGDRLDALAPRRTGWLTAVKDFLGAGRSWAPAMRPVGAVALVALGFFGARWTATQPAAVAPGPSEPIVSRVRYLQPEPSGQVRLMVEETRQRYVTGNPQDGPIQQLLLAAARESSDPGVRADSVEILKDRAASNEVRDALIYALRSDMNAGIRLRALDGLKAEVRDQPRGKRFHGHAPTAAGCFHQGEVVVQPHPRPELRVGEMGVEPSWIKREGRPHDALLAYLDPVVKRSRGVTLKFLSTYL
jgi:hypothetical protein